MERKLLSSIITDRDSFNKLNPYLDDSDWSDKGQIIWKQVVKFYECDPLAKNVDKELLKYNLRREYPKHGDMLCFVVDDLEPVSSPNVLREVLALKHRNTAIKLSNALLNGQEEEINALMDQYHLYAAGDLGNAGEDEEAETFYQTNLQEYLERNNKQGKRIKLYPKALNDAIGGKGVLPGHHLIITARPEAGKSLLAINMAACMADKGYKVLYISNEEPTLDLMFRFLSRMNGKDREWVEANIPEAQLQASKKGYNNLILHGTSRGTPKEICGLIEKFQPAVLFVDQMWKLSLPATERGSVAGISAASDFMRRMGKRYGVVAVSITQAGEHAGLIIDQDDIYMSRTSVAGDADLIIGLGINEQFERENRRMISLPKNKINGNHTHFAVRVDPKINKVFSL